MSRLVIDRELIAHLGPGGEADVDIAAFHFAVFGRNQRPANRSRGGVKILEHVNVHPQWRRLRRERHGRREAQKDEGDHVLSGHRDRCDFRHPERALSIRVSVGYCPSRAGKGRPIFLGYVEKTP